MSRDLLIETILATDKGEVNGTGDTSMSYPPSYTTGSCPEKAGDITINQTTINLADGEGEIKLHDEQNFSGTELTLPFTPIAGYAPRVFVAGLLQSLTVHYTISGSVITFVNSLVEMDVQVEYAVEIVADEDR